MNRIIGFCIVAGVLTWICFSGGAIGMFLDIPSLVLVVALLIGCCLFCFTPREVVDAVSGVVSGPGEATDAQLQRRIAVADLAYQVTWGAGVVGTLMGLIAMLADLSDPASIGAGMSVALLSTLYGALLAEFVFAPCQRTLINHWVCRSVTDESEKTDPPTAMSRSGMARGLMVVLLMLCSFFVLTTSFSEINQDAQFDAIQKHIQEAFGPNVTKPPDQSK